MEYYNPDHDQPREWLELGEGEKRRLVLEHHRRFDRPDSCAEIHILFHLMVEDQLAEGFPATVRAMARLREAGLDRHGAIHGINQVIHEYIQATKDQPRRLDQDPWNEEYCRRLDAYTIEDYLKFQVLAHFERDPRAIPPCRPPRMWGSSQTRPGAPRRAVPRRPRRHK